MTDDTGRGLLAAILAKPDDDVARLVYADYLEGDAHPRQPERAEFVRVGCELGGLVQPTAKDVMHLKPGDAVQALQAALMDFVQRRDALRRRERALWKGWGLRWSNPLVEVLAPGGAGKNLSVHDGCSGYAHRPGDTTTPLATWKFSRGFVSSLHLPLAAFLEHAPAVFGGQPVTGVSLSCRQPSRAYGGFCWFAQGRRYPEPDVLPAEFSPHVDQAAVRYGGFTIGDRAQFDSQPKALAALSSMAVSFGRAAAAGWTHQEACGGCKFYMTTGLSVVRGALGCDLCSGTGTRTLPGLPPLGEMSHGAH